MAKKPKRKPAPRKPKYDPSKKLEINAVEFLRESEAMKRPKRTTRGSTLKRRRREDAIDVAVATRALNEASFLRKMGEGEIEKDRAGAVKAMQHDRNGHRDDRSPSPDPLWLQRDSYRSYDVLDAEVALQRADVVVPGITPLLVPSVAMAIANARNGTGGYIEQHIRDSVENARTSTETRMRAEMDDEIVMAFMSRPPHDKYGTIWTIPVYVLKAIHRVLKQKGFGS